MRAEPLVESYLLYVVMPIWLIAGVADWLCHYAARIETTTGPRESLIHLLMLAEAGAAVLMGLSSGSTRSSLR